MSDDSIKFMVFSVDHINDLVPAEKNVVRGHVAV